MIELKEVVELKEVFDLLKKKSQKWDDIGQALGISLDFRQGLFREAHAATDQSKLERVLHKWIETECSDATWSKVLKVLKELGLRDVAEEVVKYLNNRPNGCRKYQNPFSARNQSFTKPPLSTVYFAILFLLIGILYFCSTAIVDYFKNL